MFTRRLIKELIETALLALAMLLALEFSVQNYRVEGSSMYPTLLEGEMLMVNKLIYARLDDGVFDFSLPPAQSADAAAASDDGSAPSRTFVFSPPKHGEIIIFHFPRNRERDFVKRVIGVPGDVLEIRNGQVIRNGEPVDEPYVTNHSSRSQREIEIPEGHYYVLGDNRRGSNDSRDWGLVPEADIIGRAWFRYWPLARFGATDVG